MAFINKVSLQLQASNPVTHTTEANRKRLCAVFSEVGLINIITHRTLLREGAWVIFLSAHTKSVNKD